VNISLGSLAEVKYLLHFSRRLGFVSGDDFDALERRYKELGGKLWKFYERVGKARRLAGEEASKRGG